MMLWSVARQAPLYVGFSSKNTEVCCHFLFQGIFPTQGSNLHLLCLLHQQEGSLPLVLPGKPYMQIATNMQTPQMPVHLEPQPVT